MADEKRKASDVLISIENRVGSLERAVKQIDLNVKTILNKLNLASFSSSQPTAKPTARPVGQVG